MDPRDLLEELRRTIQPPREPRARETEPFRIDSILLWADMEHGFPGGKWPTRRSGKVVAAPGLTWDQIDRALRKGLVDDPEFVKGRSLAWLLRKCRGVPCRSLMPDLKPSWIMRWAVEHFDVEGEWPTPSSGPIEWVPGESWRTVDNALRTGRRGMPGGSSLQLSWPNTSGS